MITFPRVPVAVPVVNVIEPEAPDDALPVAILIVPVDVVPVPVIILIVPDEPPNELPVAIFVWPVLPAVVTVPDCNVTAPLLAETVAPDEILIGPDAIVVVNPEPV
jgi:hypothetical protein